MTKPVGSASDPQTPPPPPFSGPASTAMEEQVAPPVIRSEESLLGEVFEGRYRVDALLGKGTFGAVFRGRNLRTDGEVAIKVLVPSLVSNATGLAADSLMRRFEVEARVASQLTHPNTVRVFDYGRYGEAAFMVMQVLEGDTLMDVIEHEGPVPPIRSIRYVQQVCLALAEAHAHGLVHRDIKPHNVMVVRRSTSEHRVKVLDFGTVKATDRELAGLKLTADGTVLGTAWYMSPEQAKGEEIDHRSDLYSLGVILFELLTRQLPFDSPQPARVMLQHVTDPPPIVSHVRPILSGYPKLVEVVSRCLEKDRTLRYDDATAMHHALEAAAEEVRRVREAA